MPHYAVSVIPAEHKQAMNRLVAMIEGEDVLLSENITQQASAGGEAPPTHWFGGRFVDQAWLDVYQNLGDDLPSPEGGWPLVADGAVALSAGDAEAAVAALYVNVSTGEDIAQLPQQNLASVLAALGLQRVVLDE